LTEETEPMVHGTLMAGFAQACINLNIVAGRRAADLLTDLDVARWYPLKRWFELEQTLGASYTDVDPIRLKLGIEMMTLWYHRGPGRDIIRNGADFLHFQTGSTGIASVIRGPVGSFTLREFDARSGRAVVRSTTPFNRKIECGVLIGGLLAPGDIDYVDVRNDGDPDLLIAEFH
jgi:hypothetical protein